MGLFGRGSERNTSSERQERRDSARIADGAARGTNYVRVRDVRQRHSTGTGSNGTTIKGTAHR